MKLKVKHIAQPTITHRIELPDNCSLQQARERCLSVLPLAPGSSAYDVVFSLNKKSPITGADSDTLRGLGICSGDTLWVLAPGLANTAAAAAQGPPAAAAATCTTTTTSTAAASTALTAARAAGAAAMARAQAQQQLYHNASDNAQHTGTAAAAAAVRPVASSNLTETSSSSVTQMRNGRASASTQQQQRQSSAAPNAQPSNASADSQSEAMQDVQNAAEAAAEHVELDHPPPPKSGVPDHLQRLLSLLRQQQQQQQQQQQEVTAVQLLLLAVHAAMLESGLQYCQHQQQQQQTSTAAAAAGLLPDLSGTAGVYSLGYRLPATTTAATAAAAAIDRDASSAGSSSSSSGGSSGVDILLKVMDVGNYLVVAGSIQQMDSVMHGSGGGSSSSSSGLKLVTTLNLPISNIKPASTAITAAAAAVDEHMDIDQPASSSAAAAADDDDDHSLMHFMSRYSDMFKLWVLLKDRLCLPLLLAAAAAAGLPAPVGLTSLPYELQESVLLLLQAKDLAALCCTCTPMRHRASTDTLWKPLFDRDFSSNPSNSSSSSSVRGTMHGGSSSSSGSSSIVQPSHLPDHPSSSSSAAAADDSIQGPWRASLAATYQRIRQDANRHGWKWAYGAAYTARIRVLDEQRRSLRRYWPHMFPYPNPGMPWGPFRPQNPVMPPHVIGGDYDRFPNLGGLGFGGGLGGPGGLGFSGGVITPQGFGGDGGDGGGLRLGSGGAMFSGVRGRGVLPGGGGSSGGLGFPGLGGGRRREGGGGLGRLY